MTEVSIVVPTLNAATNLRRCLDSARQQTFQDLEIIVVDALSSDDTPSIASAYGRLVQSDVGMTEARYIGTLAAKGRFVVNLDSDQVLSHTAIEEALAAKKPMVVFEETGVGSGLVALINRLEKATVQKDWRRNLDPMSGAVRPRFYERQRLIMALESIPSEIRGIRPCPYAEDTLIYRAASRMGGEVGFVPHGIVHSEEASLRGYLGKWYSYGSAASAYRGTELAVLAEARSFNRLAHSRNPAVMAALGVRAFPFFVGYYIRPRRTCPAVT
ncbi:MAG: glycosyltransferase family 2 protein [Thermoplasmata archaeon]|nr:glycosyltransferase family 2 protein [Thermoplasmata archaeon]